MAYVSVAEWRPEQVTEWLKGLDNSIISYIHWFSNNEVNGQQLLNLTPDDLTHLGVYKLGHQELILEAVQHLRNFHYELDRENLQLLALKLSCAAHSLYSEIKDQAESSSVPTQVMADVANVIHNVKPLVSWLDRPPFSGQIQYSNYKSQLLHLSLEMATCAQRDRFAERPLAKIRTCSSKLAELADSVVQDIKDPMILQPATLDLATIKKKAGEDLDFFLVPSFHGIHQIGDMKLSSPAHQSGKIQQGDEIVQVNYQTVVGWSRKKVLALFEESPNDLLLTLKRRPRHVKMYGQIYMKPYRLPSRKRSSPYSRWNDSLPSPRPELLTIPHFNIISGTVSMCKKGETDQNLSLEPSRTSSSSDEEFGQQSDSPNPPMRLYLPKPRAPIQRRFTLSGPPRPSAQSEQFWRELQLERSWRSSQNNSQMNNSSTQNVGSNGENINEMFQLRDKSASLGNSIATASSRSTTCVPFTKARIGSVKFDLSKFDSHKMDSNATEKSPTEEKDGTTFDSTIKTSHSENNFNSEGLVKEGEATETTFGPKSLSISELNKLKRDAFFNNMECCNVQDESGTKSGQEGTSEKVKRVIENFKSEINTCRKDVSELDSLKAMGKVKVMELVENFEKKEVTDIPFKAKPQLARIEVCSKSPRGKSRLDKSCSAPAYDTTEEDPDELKIDFSMSGRESKRNFNVLTDISSGNNFGLERQEKFNLQSKVVAGDNYKTDRTKDNYYQVGSNVSTPVKNQGICFESFPPNEDEARSGRNNRDKYPRNENNVVTTQSDSVGSNCYQGNQRLQSADLSWPESKATERKNNEFKSELCVPLSHSTYLKKEELIKPIPAQRKSKLSEKNITNEGYNNLGPLPPKPQPKNLTLTLEDNLNSNCIISNLQPPEPPPRPESTLSKTVSNKRSGLAFEHNREYDSECHSESDSFRESPDPRALPRKGSITPSPSMLTPSDIVFPFEVKPISPTVLSSGRKGTKQMNIVSPVTSPSVISPTTEKEKHKTSGSTLENLKAILTLGRKSSNINSPRSVRKKNAMLAKKRNVSVKEMTHCEYSGFLWHRNRKGSAVASWTKYFFILQGSNFYGFKTKESHKADLFIHLPGFTCTLAEEVKSKEFSFKIYHTGTVFYFAANSREDLQQWLDCVNVATALQDDKSVLEVVTYSQTDSDDSDTEPELETCFPTSPKMKKVLGSSNTPKSSGSHQNLASEFKKHQDTQKRFGSLKKLTSPKHSNTYSSGANDSSEVASLDRKYLRFLGQKNSPTPVPTSRFRSYRRMQPTPVVPPKGKSKIKTKNPEEASVTLNVPTKSGNQPQLMRKPLHSSNPSLIHPDMSDYRATQERLAEFRRLRNQNRPSDSNRFMNLEQFLQTRQENNLMGSRERPPELSGFITLEQFLLRQEEDRQRSNRIRDRPQPSEFRNQEQPERSVEERHEHKRQIHSEKNSPSTSNPGLVDHTEKTNLEKPKVAPRKKDLIPKISKPLKNVTMYQPPFIPHSSPTSNLGEDTIMMAFEMSLDRRDPPRIVHSPQSSVVSDLTKSAESSRSANSDTSDSREIGYSPAFEPETHTTQHMLKIRKNRAGNSEPNK